MAAIIRGIAAIGMLLVGWFFGFMAYSFGGYWLPPVVGAGLLVLGAGRLLWRRRWEGLAAGGCCWLLTFLFCLGLWVAYGNPDPASALWDYAFLTLLFAPLAITLAANAWDGVKWLWSLPLPRPQVIGILCSLSAGVLLTAKPYWVATYRGREAHLRSAVLVGAYLDSADLCGADLRGASLAGASLEGANLKGADLRGAKLTGAVYNGHTKWPDGFDPQAHGARVDPWADDDDGE